MSQRLLKMGIFLVAAIIVGFLVSNSNRNWNPRELAGHVHAIKACKILPGASRIATMCIQHVRICTVSGGSPILIAGHSDELTDMDFNKEGTVLATASKDGSVKLWDASSGIEMRSISVCKRGTVVAVDFHPQGKVLATISSDGFLRIWDVATGKVVREIKSHLQSPMCQCFNRSGDHIAVGHEKEGVAIWRWEVKTEPLHFDTEDSVPILSLEFDTSGGFLAAGRNDNLVHLWSLSDKRISKTFSGHWGAINAIKFSTESETMVSASSDWTIFIWDVIDGREIRRLIKHPSQVLCMDCDFDANLILSGGYGEPNGKFSSVKVWRGFLKP